MFCSVKVKKLGAHLASLRAALGQDDVRSGDWKYLIRGTQAPVAGNSCPLLYLALEGDVEDEDQDQDQYINNGELDGHEAYTCMYGYVYLFEF